MDTDRPLRVLQINTIDRIGGAALVAWNLHKYYSMHGIDSWMAVGVKTSDDSNVIELPRSMPLLCRVLFHASQTLRTRNRFVPKAVGLATRFDRWGQLWRDPEVNKGYENFHHPGASSLIKDRTLDFDIVHCHNLHGDYFDLRVVPWLSRVRPVVLTLHDAWLLSGHCAHSFECERWKIGCGKCPNLNVYPSIWKDATAYNFRRKQRMLSNSSFYLTTPSRWLMNKVQESMIAPAIAEARVVPNGINLAVFRAGCRMSARNKLGIPHDAKLMLSVAQSVRDNAFKDYDTLRRTVERVALSLPRDNVVCIALGSITSEQNSDSVLIRHLPYTHDPMSVAMYLQAADVYVHPARVDTFPNVVLESFACGTPVVATAVGGIPEQIKGLDRKISSGALRQLNPFSRQDATGILVPPGDSVEMARAILDLLTNRDLSLRLGENAVREAQRRFDLAEQAQQYIAWYYEILAQHRKARYLVGK